MKPQEFSVVSRRHSHSKISMNIIPYTSLHYKPKKSPKVILTDLPKDLGTDYKGKLMTFDMQCLELHSESESYFIPLLMYLNSDMSEKGISLL